MLPWRSMRSWSFMFIELRRSRDSPRPGEAARGDATTAAAAADDGAVATAAAATAASPGRESDECFGGRFEARNDHGSERGGARRAHGRPGGHLEVGPRVAAPPD
mmetsp:Transcript_35765/g.88037  ORF Transcript_35765/g.88037 Transcript_35765/m.88037 type:complete len:105 (-) Transcript_35765:593-907(-)